MNAKKVKHLSCKLPIDLHSKIIKLRKNKSINVSEITRKLWERYLEDNRDE